MLSPHELAEQEITAGILTQVDTEDCGCPVYRVAEGKASELIGQSDLISIGQKGCKLPAHNRLA